MKIDISQCDKAAVLAALYNNARSQGMGLLHYTPQDMTPEEAKQYFEKECAPRDAYFDYLNGRVMKVDLSGSAFSPRLYDRDNGEGAALEALQRAGLSVSVVEENEERINEHHHNA